MLYSMTSGGRRVMHKVVLYDKGGWGLTNSGNFFFIIIIISRAYLVGLLINLRLPIGVYSHGIVA